MNYQVILDDIAEAVKCDFGKGRVAAYIPALASVPPGKFGMALCLPDGSCFMTGDAEEAFSIQSIFKLFILQLALAKYGDMIWTRVGKEASGDRFNSLLRLEQENGIPRNPFINAGALVTLDLLVAMSRKAGERHPRRVIRNYIGYLSCNNAIKSNPGVFQSERDHAHVNRAMVHLMKAYGNIHSPVEELIREYCYLCALELNCRDLARAVLPLVNDGYSPYWAETVLHHREVKRISAVMMTCGMYDSAGSFSYRVGLPAKSGVGGGIVAVAPGKFSLAVWSPELDNCGNSYVGTAALELFTSMTQTSIF